MLTKQLDFGFPIPDGYEITFRASIATKSGRIVYAKWYGIRGSPWSCQQRRRPNSFEASRSFFYAPVAKLVAAAVLKTAILAKGVRVLSPIGRTLEF